MPGPSSEANQRRLRLGTDLAAVARTATPYGAVGIEIRIGDIAVPIINPIRIVVDVVHADHTLFCVAAALRGGWPCARGLVR